MDLEWNLHLHEWKSQIVGLFVFVSFFGWLVGLIGDCWLGFLLVWVSNLLKVGLLGFNLLEMCFSRLRFFFFFWLVVLYFWIDLVLWGFGIWSWFCWVWEKFAFKLYDFVFELKFFGFFVCLFPKKIFGFSSLFIGE